MCMTGTLSEFLLQGLPHDMVLPIFNYGSCFVRSVSYRYEDKEVMEKQATERYTMITHVISPYTISFKH